MREDYVLLNLSQEQQPFIVTRKSWWRAWKQLSRLQRNLITILCLLFLVTIHYLWIRKQDTLDEVDLNSSFTTETTERFHAFTPGTNEKGYQVEEVIDDVEQPDDALHPPFIPDKEENVLPKSEAEEGELKFSLEKMNSRQEAVVGALRHAWEGYKAKAWGHDHVKPVSGKPHDWFRLGLTVVDSLDTLYIMNLKKEYLEARDWVEKKLSFNEFNDVNLFEVTIRVLGGLLAAFHLTNDSMYKYKAKDLGERLLPCFTRSPSAIPYSDVNLASHNAHSPRWGPDSSTSEVTTIQLEFRDLSRITNDNKFEDAASQVSAHVHTLPKTEGLVPVFINPRTGLFQSFADIKLGARGDSYYEYLVKQWIQTGKTIDYLRDDYLEAVRGIQHLLAKRTHNRKLLFIGELKGGSKDFVPKMDHLVCYLPGTLALGYHHGLPESHMNLALDLLYTCYRTYADRPTFLAPEITYFNLQDDGRDDMYVKTNDAHNLLRPEFIESLWYMYQITGNTTYQDWGWTIFQSIERYTKAKWGYTSISNVNNPEDGKPRDMMESYFFSETLKYLFLLFSDDRKLLDIDKFVVNSEGHPMPIYSS